MQLHRRSVRVFYRAIALQAKMLFRCDESYPAAATGIPLVGLFISPSAFAAADASDECCEWGSFACIAAGEALRAGTGGWVGLGGAGGRTCGRHRCKSFVVGALASSSGSYKYDITMIFPELRRIESLQFRQRSSTASMQMSRAGGFIKIR